MIDFRQALDGNNLFDVRWKGNLFTWSNIHSDSTFTKERFDRIVCNCSWSKPFQDGIVEVLGESQSDHKALCLDLNPKKMNRRKKKRMFKFEQSGFWMRREGRWWSRLGIE